MFTRVALATVAACFTASPQVAVAQGMALTSEEHWDPYSRTASAITGKVIFTPSRVTFENGKSLKLMRIGTLPQFASMYGKRAAILYKVTKPDDPVLLQGNRLCGGPKTPKPVTFFVVISGGAEKFDPDRELVIFTSGDVPTSDKDTCATYNYSLPNKI